MENTYESRKAQLIEEFRVDSFRKDLPQVRQELLDIGLTGPRKIFFEITDEEYLRIFGEWRYRGFDVVNTTSYLLEVLATKSLNPIENHTSAENKFKDVFFSLTQYQNQQKLWGSEHKSYADDLVVKQTGTNIEIQKVIEVKLSTQQIRVTKQREKALMGLVPLINALNGDMNAIHTAEGRRIIEGARNELHLVGIHHINLQPSYKYVYAVPTDQGYRSNTDGIDCAYIPVTSDNVKIAGKIIFNYFRQKYSELQKNTLDVS